MLYSFLLSIFSQNKENNNYYISPDGLKFENFGNISVIGTMNNSRLSNSRSSLSSSFINLCHCFKIKNYSEDEIRLLCQTKLLGEEQIFKFLNFENLYVMFKLIINYYCQYQIKNKNNLTVPDRVEI